MPTMAVQVPLPLPMPTMEVQVPLPLPMPTMAPQVLPLLVPMPTMAVQVLAGAGADADHGGPGPCRREGRS